MEVTAVPRAARRPERGTALQGTALGSGVWGLGFGVCHGHSFPWYRMVGAGMEAGMLLALLPAGIWRAAGHRGTRTPSLALALVSHVVALAVHQEMQWKGGNGIVTPVLNARGWRGSHRGGARRGHESWDLVPGPGAKGTEPGRGSGEGSCTRLEQEVALEAQEGMGTLGQSWGCG